MANEVAVDPVTGQKFIPVPPRTKPQSIRLRAEVPGLHAFESPLSIKFVWIRPEPIDEADARDAQCRAGWSDIHEGHGFYSFETFQREDGLFEASWRCWGSTE